MKIRGLEGLGPDELRSEIERGARFVAFPWTVSIVVMTFKRSSGIHLVRPGQGAFGPNFCWSLLTCLLGWWGIPWGPIYSFQSLWSNIRGGVDLTDELVPQLLPPDPSTKEPARAPAPVFKGFSPAPFCAAGATALAVIAAIGAVRWTEGRNMPVALVNGLGTAYTVEVNGTAHKLAPHSVRRITEPEGPFTVTAALPGGAGESTFTFTTDEASDGLFTRKVLVINPDASALIVRESTCYTATGAPGPQPEPPKPDVAGGRQFYVLPSPDFFLDPFPANISMPKSSGHVMRNRVYPLAQFPFAACAGILEEHAGHEDMVAYLGALGRLLPESEEVLDLAARALKPAEAAQFFGIHLGTRPVLVNWHRYYQQYASRMMPEIDLPGTYRVLAAAEPGEGALAYLYGRISAEPDEALAWYRKALDAPRPCAYAHGALAYHLAGQADFTGALQELDKAAEAGAATAAFQYSRMECLLALGRHDEALRVHLAGLRKEDRNMDSVSTEMAIAFLAGGREAGQKVIDARFAGLSAGCDAAGKAQLRRLLDGMLAYAGGNPESLKHYLGPDTPPALRFIGAVCAGDISAAEGALAGVETQDSSSWLILYLEACRQKDQRSSAYWNHVMAALEGGTPQERRIAAHLRGAAPMDPRALLDLPVTLSEKRLLLAALGTRDPANRRAFFERALRCNIDPQFPHHLIAAIAGPATARR